VRASNTSLQTMPEVTSRSSPPADSGAGEATGTGVSVGIGVAVGMGVSVGMGIAVGMGVAVGMGIAAGAGISVAVGVAAGDGSEPHPITSAAAIARSIAPAPGRPAMSLDMSALLVQIFKGEARREDR